MAVARQDIWESARATRLGSGTAAGATTLTAVTGGLSTWGPVVHGKFPVIVDRGSAFEEHLYGTAIAGDQITGLTQVDGTPGMTYDHSSSVPVEHGLLAEHVDDANELLSMPTAAGQFLQSTAADTWGVTSDLIAPGATAPAQTAEGSLVWDTNDDVLTVGTGAGRKTLLNTDSGQTVTNKAFGASVGDLTNTWTSGTVNMVGGVFFFPNSTAPAQTGEGWAIWDSNDDVLTIGTGSGSPKRLVNEDGAQTLTSKTLVAPTIADFSNAQHDHGDADDGGALAVAFADYTPALTASVTNPNLGATGTATGRYIQIGKFVYAMAEFVWGGAGVTAGSGTYRVSLPVTPATLGATSPANCGAGRAHQATGGTIHLLAVDRASGDVLNLRSDGETSVVTGAVPFTWGTAGDKISIHFMYEAA